MQVTLTLAKQFLISCIIGLSISLLSRSLGFNMGESMTLCVAGGIVQAMLFVALRGTPS